MVEQRSIRIDPDGIATYERTMPLDGNRERVLESIRARTQALLPAIDETIVLPERCRMFLFRGKRRVFIIESEPAVRTVCWSPERMPWFDKRLNVIAAQPAFRRPGEDEKAARQRLRAQQEFELAFPYLVWCYTFFDRDLSSVSLWYRTEPLNSADDVLFEANLPNLANNGTICFPRDELDSAWSYTKIVRIVENAIWLSEWTDESSENVIAAAKRITRVASPWEWELATKQDPRFVLRVHWARSSHTVRRLVEKGIGSSGEVGKDAFEAFVQRARLKGDRSFLISERPIVLRDDLLVLRDALNDRDIFFRTGDYVVFANGVHSAVRPGAPYRVLAFKRKGSGHAVRLDGVRRAVRLSGSSHNHLRSGIIRASVAGAAPPVLSTGLAVVPGCFCWITRSNVWRGIRPGTYEIVMVRREAPSGWVSVQLAQGRPAGWYRLAQNGCLRPGIELLPPERCQEDDDNLLDATALTLRDGTIIRKGDRVVGTDPEGEDEFVCIRINGFYERAYSGPGQGRLVRGWDHYGEDDIDIEIEDTHGRLHPDVAILPKKRIRTVRIGDRTIQVGDDIEIKDDWDRRRILELSPRSRNGCIYARHQTRYSGDEWVLLGRGRRLKHKVFPVGRRSQRQRKRRT